MGGKSKGSAKVEINDYYLSVHMGICLGPLDALLSIIIGDKLAWSGSASTEQGIYINQPGLFGGNKKEGGIVGEAWFKPGTGPGTTMPEKLARRLGRTSANCPAFTDIASLFLTNGGNGGGMLVGSNSPYLKSVAVKVRRLSNTFPAKPGKPSNYYNINGNCNPAHIIYECLTNAEWGMGGSPALINTTSFQDAAELFFNEGFGLSMIWTQQSSIESFIQEVCDHVQATVFVNVLTGLIDIKPIRADYDAATIPELNPTNCKVTKFERKSWGETINEINVTWTNPENESEQTVTIHDLANIELQGSLVSDTRNYYGIRDVNLAMRVAARDIRTASAPLASFSIEADRTLFGIKPGGVVKLVYPEIGADGVVLRLGHIDYGRPGESTIKIEAIEDIFGLPQSAYSGVADTQWSDGGLPATDFDYVEILTLPVYFTGQVLDSFALPQIEYPEVLAGLLGATENRDTRSYELYGEIVQANGSLAFGALGTRAPMSRSTLSRSISAEAVTVLSDVDMNLATATVGTGPIESGFLIIGQGGDLGTEIVLIDSITGGDTVFTLRRGVFDTVPREWPAGTPVWFVANGSVWGEETLFSDGSTPKFRVTPSTTLGQLALDDAADRVGTLTGRPHLPQRPAAVTVAGVGFGAAFVDAGVGPYTVAWARRNRLTETSQVVHWSDGDITPEAGQTTRVQVLDVDRSVITVHSGLTGTSFALPEASFGGRNIGIVRVTSVRDGLESLQGHEILVSFGTGYGTDYGNNYGSIA